MVANLSVGKGEFDDRYDQLCELAERAQELKDALVRGVDADTQAFDLVIAGLRMPKDTPEEKEVRAQAIQEGYKAATRVPLATVQQCRDALALCLEMVRMAPEEMLSDAGTGALVARAGLIGAAYNVRINLKSIDDESFRNEMMSELTGMVEEGEGIAKDVEGVMEEGLGG
jgi:glutamate formiminotransferase/formiminotetrahydrofolate cyclodeaminase